MLINIKIPTTVVILTFMSRKNSCLAGLSMKKIITSGPELPTLLFCDGIAEGDIQNANVFNNYFSSQTVVTV